MARIVCFGEVLLRLSAPGRELLLQSPSVDVHFGGAEANVAVALARLGHEAAMVTRLPANLLGDAAIGHLRRYGVSVEAVTRGEGRMGIYFLSPGAGLRASSIIYDREGSSFTLAPSDAFDWGRLLDGATLLHVSGITAALGGHPADAAIEAVEAARSIGVKVSFDANYRPQLWQRSGADPKAMLSKLVAKSDFLFGNHRDIALLLGRQFPREGSDGSREAAEAAFASFPNLQMIASTDRRVDDADRNRIAARLHTPAGSFGTEDVVLAGIVDRIGAGDAFAAGVLHGMLGGGDYERALQDGLALACLKHSLPGDASLFTQADIDAFLTGEFDVRR